MIPLRDDQPTNSFPLVTVLLIALNVLVYVGQQILPLDQVWAMVPFEITNHVDLSGMVAHLTQDGQLHLYKIPPGGNLQLGPNDIVYGPAPHPLWLTIFTSMFLHGSLLHIGGNMLYLWIFGNNIEDVLGKVRFLLFYLACGLAAAVAQIAISPNSLVPNLGASGAIAGVLGAYFILFPNARVLTLVPIFIYFLAQIRAYWILLFWIVMNVFQGFSGLGMERGGGVAYFAHIGGFFAGIILISLLGGQSLVVRSRQAYRGGWPDGYR